MRVVYDMPALRLIISKAVYFDKKNCVDTVPKNDKK